MATEVPFNSDAFPALVRKSFKSLTGSESDVLRCDLGLHELIRLLKDGSEILLYPL